jgi:hypothetical protein
MYLPPALSRAFHRSDDALRRRGVWKTYDLLREIAIVAARADRGDAARKGPAPGVDAPAPARRTIASLFARAGIDPASLAIGIARRTAAADQGSRPPPRRRDPAPQARGVKLLPNSTGGSTGSNLHFWVDGDCLALARRDRPAALGHDRRPPGRTAAYVWGSPMDQKAAGKLRQRVRVRHGQQADVLRLPDRRRRARGSALAPRPAQAPGAFRLRVRVGSHRDARRGGAPQVAARPGADRRQLGGSAVSGAKEEHRPGARGARGQSLRLS